MTTVVKIKTPLVVPPALQRRAGISPGDHVEMKAIRGVITIVSKPQAADDEYTPEQRRILDARLSRALEDVKQGRTYGPFETHKEMMKFLNRRTSKKVRGRTITKSKSR